MALRRSWVRIPLGPLKNKFVNCSDDWQLFMSFDAGVVSHLPASREVLAVSPILYPQSTKAINLEENKTELACRPKQGKLHR
jgi:hypothetical protein